jgi:hypothetical protein
LKRLFRELFFRKGYSYDNQFDWVSQMGAETTSDPPQNEDAKPT